MSATLFPEVDMGLPGFPAAWSPCRAYRYTLWRRWCGGQTFVQFIGLNPSTADETRNDPTLTRCINFAQAWGFDGLCMTNLFAYRATDPRDMKAAQNPVGDMNDTWLWRVSRQVDMVVACWGVHGTYRNRDREVIEAMPVLHCLKLTKEGLPSHPLMLPGNLEPIAFEDKRA